jgi:hypothetical protein
MNISIIETDVRKASTKDEEKKKSRGLYLKNMVIMHESSIVNVTLQGNLLNIDLAPSGTTKPKQRPMRLRGLITPRSHPMHVAMFSSNVLTDGTCKSCQWTFYC